jgi:glutaconyl-CoA/methylmalonyl-CoA decarboxylase subunit gamma
MLRQLRITVDGHEYNVTVEDLTDTGNQLYPQHGSMVVTPPPASAPAPQPVEQGGVSPTVGAPALPVGNSLVAPMSGVVVEVMVSVGQQVSAGETVAVIEAMKMKTPIVMQQSGTVAAINASVGDAVQVGQAILTLS